MTYILDLSYNQRQFIKQFLPNDFLDVEEHLEDVLLLEHLWGITLIEEVLGLLGGQCAVRTNSFDEEDLFQLIKQLAELVDAVNALLEGFGPGESERA